MVLFCTEDEGIWVGVECKHSNKPGEGTKIRAAACEFADGVGEFFGWGPLAVALYEDADILCDMVLDVDQQCKLKRPLATVGETAEPEE